jgi:hypothetical protein
MDPVVIATVFTMPFAVSAGPGAAIAIVFVLPLVTKQI